MKSYANSGAGAISAAIHAGAQKIILLGYDCQHSGGKSHWHGDHPINLGNAQRCEAWVEEFAKMKAENSGVQILNASRETALECFERVSLEGVL